MNKIGEEHDQALGDIVKEIPHPRAACEVGRVCVSLPGAPRAWHSAALGLNNPLCLPHYDSSWALEM